LIQPNDQTPNDPAASNTADGSQPAQPSQPHQNQATQQPTQTTQPAQNTQQPTAVQPSPASRATGTVSNAASPANNPAAHPSVQRASLINTIGEALAGGPRWKTAIDPTTGQVTRTKVPLSRGDIGMAIAVEALSGALSGLSVPNGPGNLGRAAGAGYAQQVQLQTQQRQEQEQQAQQDAKDRSDALTRAASIADINARTLLSTAEAESRGADTIQKIADTNKALIDSYDDQGLLLAHNVTQQELIEGMQGANPKYSSTAMLGPIDGYRLLGNGRVEATHAITKDPYAKVPLTQVQYDDYASNHVQGFLRGVNIGDSSMVSGAMLARANEQKTMFQLAQQRHDEVADALRSSDDPKVQALANQVSSIGSLLDDPKTGAGLATALSRFQSYVSHADISHGGRDLYESLQAMAQPSVPDPNNPKQSVPNKNAPFANQVAQAFGGWNVLKAYHDEVVPEQITSEAQAADMIASSEPGSRAAKYAQRWIQSNTAQKVAIAGGEERAREAAKPHASSESLTQPDAFGNVPTVTDPKEASKRFGAFKKNLDSLNQTEQTYNQFQSIANDVKAGKLTGAESVVALLSAVGISAAPLKGNGFRVSKDILNEHKNARGWEQSMQQKFLGAADGDVITPKQIMDYSNIAANARTSQYVNLANQMRNAGLSVDPALPTGNGQKLDPNTAQIFLTLAGGDKNKARTAASQKGWSF